MSFKQVGIRFWTIRLALSKLWPRIQCLIVLISCSTNVGNGGCWRRMKTHIPSSHVTHRVAKNNLPVSSNGLHGSTVKSDSQIFQLIFIETCLGKLNITSPFQCWLKVKKYKHLLSLFHMQINPWLLTSIILNFKF